MAGNGWSSWSPKAGQRREPRCPESLGIYSKSLRGANAVKDALVRDGVPAQAISVVGMGERGLLVQTGDNVREPQNRRVEIVIQ
jgi:OmpA-OmpF porin, OOP family